MVLTTVLTSSLAKIFPDEDMTKHPKFKSASALKGERFSFQVAYKFAEGWGGTLTAEVESELKKYITLRSTELAPVKFTGYLFDDDMVGTKPGLYPDI
ncbi:MAG: hypothetical protein IKB74_03915, partial [Lentisphaeria bacterium]|nr:hypothetical protein [Lentisphaeria bacterium]